MWARPNRANVNGCSSIRPNRMGSLDRCRWWLPRHATRGSDPRVPCDGDPGPARLPSVGRHVAGRVHGQCLYRSRRPRHWSQSAAGKRASKWWVAMGSPTKTRLREWSVRPRAPRRGQCEREPQQRGQGARSVEAAVTPGLVSLRERVARYQTTLESEHDNWRRTRVERDVSVMTPHRRCGSCVVWGWLRLKFQHLGHLQFHKALNAGSTVGIGAGDLGEQRYEPCVNALSLGFG